MNALLLSAGKGERLKPLTLKTPKCLLLFPDGKPALQYWIEMLNSFKEIDSIIVNTYWLADKIEEFINNLPEELKMKIEILEENYLYPTGKVLLELREELGKEFLVINCDTWLRKKEVRFIVDQSFILPFSVILGITWDKISGKGLCVLKDSLIKEFTEKPKALEDAKGWVYCGILKANSGIFNYIKSDKDEITNDILPRLSGVMQFTTFSRMLDLGDRNGLFI